MKKELSWSEGFVALLVLTFGLPVLIAAVLLVVGFFDALAIVHLWKWFAVPALGVKPLTMPLAYGLALIVTCVISHGDDHAKDKDKAAGSTIITQIARPLMALGIGWIVQAVWL